MYLTVSHARAPTIFASRLYVTFFESVVSLDKYLNNFSFLSWINIFKLSVKIFTIRILNRCQWSKYAKCTKMTWALGFRPEEQPSNLFPRWWKGFLHLRCLRGPRSLVTQAENTRPQPEVYTSTLECINYGAHVISRIRFNLFVIITDVHLVRKCIWKTNWLNWASPKAVVRRKREQEVKRKSQSLLAWWRHPCPGGRVLYH